MTDKRRIPGASLSLVAIGLALHIQSLPEGTPFGVKALAAKFPEGEFCVPGSVFSRDK